MTESSGVHNIFDKYSQNREKLLQICDQCIAISRSVGQNAKAEAISGFREKLQDDRFRLIVLGAFKRGKSTFINAMLGQEVLPNFATPCTAVINEVKWGEKKSIKIHFKNPLPEQLPDGVVKEALDHIKKHRNDDGGVPPLEVGVDQLEHYVVITDPAKDQAEGVAESPFAFAELFWPLDLCKNGIEVIDSPGLDEHESRTRVTEMYLAKADAILFVQSCSALAGKSEMNFIENNLYANGFEDIVFICNRFDEVKEKERQRVKDYALSKLGSKTSLKERGIFFISAADALEGRLEKKEELVAGSGLVELEKQLFQFLVENRGKIKTLQPARKLLHQSSDLTRDIGNARKLFSENLAVLQQRSQALSKEAVTEQTRVGQICKQMNIIREGIRKDAEDRFFSLFTAILVDAIEREMKGYVPQSKISFLTWESTTEQAKKLSTEIQSVIGDIVESTQAKWNKEEFQPFLERQLTQMGDSVNDAIESVLQSVDRMRDGMVGIDQDGIARTQQVSGWERLLAGAGGFIVSGVGGAMMGGMFGYGEMIKNILPSIGIIIGSLIVGITNPWILVALLFTGGTVQGMLKLKSVTTKIKDKVVEDYIRGLKDNARKASKDASEEVYAKTGEIVALVETGLKAEIQSVLDMADNAIQEQALGENDKKQKMLGLEKSEEDLLQMRTQLDDLIMEVAL